MSAAAGPAGAEALRRAALEELGNHADPRAREALARAGVTLVEGAAAWAGSAGPVRAHRVILAVDARMLGTLRAAPGLTDALCAALAAAVAARPGEALLDLTLQWNQAATGTRAGYRGAPPPEPRTALRDALVEYLEGRGEPEVARLLAPSQVDAPRGNAVVTARVDPAARARLDADPRAREALAAALRDLLADERAALRLG